MTTTRRRFARSGLADTGARRMRVTLLALLVGIQIVTLAVATFAWSQSSDTVLRHQMTGDLQLTTAHAAEKISRHLDGPTHLRDLLARLVPTLGDRNVPALESTFLAALESNPEVAGVFVGRQDGSFLFVTRQNGSFLTKEISVSSATRSVERRIRSQVDSAPIAASVTDDLYDPRSRPWYQQARAKNGPTWTNIYEFATSKRPGITTASALKPPGLTGSVVGVDVELSEINKYVASIRVSQHGTAMIVNADGQILGARSDHPLQRNASARDNEAFTTALTSAMPSKKVSRFTFKGRAFAVNVLPIAASPQWFVAVAAPESDFLQEQRLIESRLLTTAIAVALTTTLFGLALFLLLRRRVDRLASRASIDSLTGALNRGRVSELAKRRLQRNQRDNKSTYICLLDIDGFKRVNDSYGHPEGDRVIRTLSERLSDGLRVDDLLGRYGGEEFFVLLNNIENPADAFAAIDRLRTGATAEPIMLGNELVSISLSAGIAGTMCADSNEGNADGYSEHNIDIDLTELTRRADKALYVAKERGRNRTVSYSPYRQLT